MVFAPLGDSAVVITLGAGLDAGTFTAVNQLTARLRAAMLKGVTDVVPAYNTVTVFYEPTRCVRLNRTPYAEVCGAITAATQMLPAGGDEISTANAAVSRQMEIPVCYGGENGPDLPEMAAHAGLAEREIIARHSQAEYRVQAIGFAPGFPYLSGLPRELAMPRRSSPRTHVPAGSVGIGGAQTGVYPRTSPGGWRLIGRTPLTLFDVQREEPAWLRVGDLVKFCPMTSEEFASWK